MAQKTTSRESPAIQGFLVQATREHRAGRLEDAKQLYLRVLAIDVQHAKSLYGLGLIAHQVGSLDVAANMMRRAIAANDKEATYHASLGAVLRDQGKQDEAIAEYQQVVKLKPDSEEAHFYLAKIFLDQRKINEARPHFERLLALNPDSAETQSNFGLLLMREGKPEEAKACYERALALQPNSIPALCNLGNLLCSSGKFEEAKTCYRRAIALDPNFAEGHNNLGVVFRELGKFEEAQACHERAVALRPDYADAHNNLGIVFRDRGMLDESAACHERAISLWPDYSEAHNNLGNTRRSQGRLEESLRSYRQALVVNPDNVEARWNLSLVELLTGDFAAGWRDYEIRTQRRKCATRVFPEPLWRGAALNGARILLHAEQGLGDTVQFLRYVPMVQAAGGTVTLDVQNSLLRLAAQLPGIATLVVSGEPLPPFECHCPLMSLPLAFGISIANIPAQVPYLNVPVEAQRDAERLEWPDEGLRVGLVWSGNPRFPDDWLRSIPLPCFDALLHVEGVRFFSLQMGPAASQLGEIEAPVIDLKPAIGDLADTAALIGKLDLVITVDTAVAHLAGALGKPTWLLLPFAPDWRWLMEREDSPWYPTMRLFRQPKFGDWTPVLERVRNELAVLVRRNRRTNWLATWRSAR
ncbi:MAG: tetratricopeptide repeat protein [Terracidiphilus sp.]